MNQVAAELGHDPAVFGPATKEWIARIGQVRWWSAKSSATISAMRARVAAEPLPSPVRGEVLGAKGSGSNSSIVYDFRHALRSGDMDHRGERRELAEHRRRPPHGVASMSPSATA